MPGIRLDGVPRTLDAALLERWAGAAVVELERHRPVIDEINVFPVADRDTGTNLLLTMRAAAAEAGFRGSSAAVAEALARGALLGARGNSGVILSQVLRGMALIAAATRVAELGDIIRFDNPRQLMTYLDVAQAMATSRSARCRACPVRAPSAGSNLR